MEGLSSFTWLTAFLLAAAATFILLPWIYSINKSPKQKPPGPPAWPLIGNIFNLGTNMPPHQNLYQLRPKYGPVLWMKLGSIDTMVVQSAKAAANLFKNNDLSFSDRKIPDAMTAWNYNQGSLVFANYGPYWRLLRKLCSMELLVNKRVKDSTDIRERCVEKMIDEIEKNKASDRRSAGEVELVHLFFIMAFNVVGNLMLSRDLLDFNSNEGHEFFEAMSKVMMWAGKPNIADFLPFLKWLDPLNVKKNMIKDMGIALNIVSSFVKERSHGTMSTKTVKNDFLNMLLEYKNDGKEGPDDKISEKNINIIILEMFFAGSETTSSTIEWAMAELLRHPESMRKVKAELDSVLMPSNRYVKESDIDKLTYLHAVVKETLRLHPAIPLLIPRNAMEDTNFMGYHIPKNTQVFVNAWAIGRDPDAWEDALSFKPERFLGSDIIDYKGQHFELIPFGSGRRICVGMALADRVVHLSLANLLWSFDWELGSSVSTPDNIDMTESMGITLRMKEPLKAIPRKRSVK